MADWWDEAPLHTAPAPAAAENWWSEATLAPPPAAQMQGPMRLPAMAGSNLAKGALEGVGSLGDLSDLLHAAFTRGVFNPLHQLVTGRPATAAMAAQTNPQVLPQGNALATGSPFSSSALTGLGSAAGVVDRPDLQPQNTGERYLAAGAEGAGQFLPFGALSPGGILANTARAGVQGIGAGTAGQAAAEALPEHPVAARFGGNIFGALTAGGAMTTANKLLGASQGNVSPTVQAYQNLGIEPRLAGDVTGSPALQMTQSYAAKSPGGANRVHAASEDAVRQWGDALDRTAANFGTSATLQDAGTALQGESRTWLQNWRNAQQQAEAAVSALVPAGAPVDVTPVLGTLQQTTSRMPGLPSVANIMADPTFQRLSTALTRDAATGTAPWSDMRAWRSTVGEELQKSLLARDGNQAAWRQLYGSISQSLGDTATANGAGAEWTAANAVSANGHDFVENVLGKFINNRNPARNTIRPEDAASLAIGGATRGGTDLAAIRQEMPTAADELAAFKLRDMGLANAGQQNATATRLSPGTFLTDQAKLSPEALNALFLNDPRLADLSTVAGSMKGTERFLNTSNTGTHMATGHAIGSAIAAPAAVMEGYAMGGVPGAVASGMGALALPYVPSYIAARATTSPFLTGLMAAPGATPQSAGLLNRAAIYPPALRALLAGTGGLP